MNACLCCVRKIPVSSHKVCPLCGHSLMGHGWSGIGYHWKVRHEASMPFVTFWAGLCEPHLANHPPASIPTSVVEPSPTILPTPEAGGDPRNMVLARRAGDPDNVLIQSLISAVADGLWQRDHCLDLQVFKPELGESAFDLVLGCNKFQRNIQIKQLPALRKAVEFSLRQDSARMSGGCAVVLVYRPITLEIEHYLFFEGGAGMPMPSLKDFPAAKPQRLRYDDREMQKFEYRRNVPQRLFAGPLNVADLVNRLYPVVTTRIRTSKKVLGGRRDRDGGAKTPWPGVPQIGYADGNGNSFQGSTGDVDLYAA
jgi:hypothetical protein